MRKRIVAKGDGFMDPEGKVFIPHGINMVCKDKETGYLGNYGEEDFRFLKENGFNLIRLGLQWCAIEPEPGVYSETYLQGVEEIIKRAAAADIPVFLDMHQDLYGVKFEDGAPIWATADEGAEHIRTELWSDSYLVSPAVQKAFDHFWDNTPAPDGVGIRDHYVRMWQMLAARFGKDPYVIGYDVMNEPFPGTPGAEVGAILAGFFENGGQLSFEDEDAIHRLVEQICPITAGFETETLCPFYDEVAAAIRSVDPLTIFMFESNYFANAGIPSFVRPAVNKNGEAFENQAYVPHGYDILVDTKEYEVGGTDRVAFIFQSLLQHAKEMGLPTLIGEWGCYPGASLAQKEQARFLLDLFAEAGVGQTYYDFSHIRDGGILEVLRR